MRKRNNDVICSAALAFHKAIIGLTQLEMSEKVRAKGISICRTSKAVLTYYVVYHIFTMCMLLSENYDVSKQKKSNPPTLDELNSDSEMPEQWNKQMELESDYATRIKHFDIKNYCKNLRSQNILSLSPIEIILFDNFIQAPPNDTIPCIKGMYEKLCYIRDRVIYRPSYVETADGYFVQTSLDLKKEIDSLPDIGDLYSVITAIYRLFLTDMDISIEHYMMLHFIWKHPVESSREDIMKLGFSGDDFVELTRLSYDEDGLGINSHVGHLVELYDNIEEVKYYINKYWEPLYRMYEKNKKNS